MSVPQHPMWLNRAALWRQWLECWRGGEYFRAASVTSTRGTNIGTQSVIAKWSWAGSEHDDLFTPAAWLWSHSRESDKDYAERVVRSSFRRYAGFALDVLAAGVTEGVPPPTTRLGTDWLARCTHDGQDIRAFRRSVALGTELFGHVWIGADKPDGAIDAAPYLYVVSPLDVIDWRVKHGCTLEWALVRERRAMPRALPFTSGPWTAAVAGPQTETAVQYRLWTETYSRLYDGDGKPLGEEVPNALERVPLEFACRTRDPWAAEPCGISDMADLAPVNLREYNLRSLRDRILTDTCFPFLAIACVEGETSVSPQQQIEIGTDVAVGYDARGGPPLWVQPSSESIETITGQIREDVQTIRELAGLNIAKEDSAAGITAEALRLIRANLDARFSAHAAQLQDAEIRTIRMAQELAGLGPDGVESQWPSDYGAQESGGRLDDVAKALDLGLRDSPRATAELLKSAFANILPGAPQRVTKQVVEDLEAAAAEGLEVQKARTDARRRALEMLRTSPVQPPPPQSKSALDMPPEIDATES